MIKLTDILFEIKITNPNIRKYQEVWDKCWDDAMDEIAMYDDDDDTEIVNEDDVSDLARDLFFEKTGKKVDDLDLKEIKINQPIIIKNFPIILNRDNVDKVFKFLNNLGYKWTGGDNLLTKDDVYYAITDKLSNGEKIYLSVDYENEIYYSDEKDVIMTPERLEIIPIKRQDLDEIKVIRPKQIKIPLIINSKEEYLKLIPYLNTQGYTWMGLSFKENDLIFITFPIKFEFNDSDKDLRL